MEVYDLTLKHPRRWIIFGPSGSGKTTFVEQLLIHSEDLFGSKFDTINYVSGQGFPSIDQVYGIKVNKMNEIDNDLVDYLDPLHRNLLIFDDNIYITDDKLLSDIFTKVSHHKNITVILLLQNLCPKTKYARDISINSTYIVLMANPRDTTQIQKLSQQKDGTNFIKDCYIAETDDKPYSYLLLDYDQDTSKNLRFRSNIFPNEQMIAYVKKEKKPHH